MNKKVLCIKEVFLKLIMLVAENKYLEVLKIGIISVSPVFIFTSIILFFAFFTSIQVSSKLFALVLLTQSIVSIMLLIIMSNKIANIKEMNSNVIVANTLLCYLIIMMGSTINNPIEKLINFSTTGIYVAIICAFTIPQLNYLLLQKIRIFKFNKFPIPHIVFSTISELITSSIVIVLIYIIVNWMNIDIENLIVHILSPFQLLFIGNTVLGPILIVLVVTLLWYSGIHGMSAISVLFRPFWLFAITSNMIGITNDATVNFIASEPFYQWFVWIGGTGGTIGLLIATMLVAKSNRLKSSLKISKVSSIFNINESLIFGYPVVNNKKLIIPFICGPVVVTLLSYSVIKAGFVRAPFLVVPWLLPAPIGAFLSTMDFNAIWLVLMDIIILTLIYLPFVHAYDRECLIEEKICKKGELC